jgi:hypothetical protein
LKRFRGWEPATHHVYDGQWLVRTVPDVEWDEDQQGWMLALGLYRKGRCPGCGGDLATTTDGKNEDRFRHELPLQCFRCVAFARAGEEDESQPRPNTFVHLVPQRPNRKR